MSKTAQSLTGIALQKFKKNFWGVFSFGFIVLLVLLSIFAYVLAPDNSQNANWGDLTIRSKKPGFEVKMLSVPLKEKPLSGFGDYVLQTMQDNMERGIYVINRKGKNFNDAAEQMTNYMFQFIQQSRRERITLRNKVESSSELFDWKVLRSYYDRAHDMALKRLE